VDPVSGRVIDLARLDALAEREILAPFRYRNLNEEFAAFRQAVPTTENLGLEVDRRLRAAWGEMFPATDRQLEPATGPQLEPAMGPQLEKVRIWETDRNICEITDVE
jgi:6-pyruvoyl-tetrahydropterin synthase